MSWSTDVRLALNLVRGDLELPEGAGVTVLKDGILFPSRFFTLDANAEAGPDERQVRILSFETVPKFQVGEIVGLYDGHVELGSGRVIAFATPRKLYR